MITHTVDLHEYLSDNIYDYPLMSMGKVGKVLRQFSGTIS
jgi:hypothetical protein